jgi:hypothetical protein
MAPLVWSTCDHVDLVSHPAAVGSMWTCFCCTRRRAGMGCASQTPSGAITRTRGGRWRRYTVPSECARLGCVGRSLGEGKSLGKCLQGRGFILCPPSPPRGARLILLIFVLRSHLLDPMKRVIPRSHLMTPLDSPLIQVSNFGVELLESLEGRPPMVVQNWMDPLHHDRAVREYCQHHRILYTSYSTLGTQWQWRNNGVNPVLTNPVITEVRPRGIASLPGGLLPG